MAAWNDPFGERIRANVRRCDRCGTELDEGDNAYFTGLDMLCRDCAEAEAKALYDLLQDVLGDEESAIEDNLEDMQVVLDEWGEGHVA